MEVVRTQSAKWFFSFSDSEWILRGEEPSSAMSVSTRALQAQRRTRRFGKREIEPVELKAFNATRFLACGRPRYCSAQSDSTAFRSVRPRIRRSWRQWSISCFPRTRRGGHHEKPYEMSSLGNDRCCGARKRHTICAEITPAYFTTTSRHH